MKEKRKRELKSWRDVPTSPVGGGAPSKPRKARKTESAVSAKAARERRPSGSKVSPEGGAGRGGGRKPRAHKPRAIGRNRLKKEPVPEYADVRTLTAVDPGWVNMGVCKQEASTGKVLEWVCLDVAAYMDRAQSRNGRADFCGNDELVNKVYEMMRDPKYKSLFDSDLLAVEEQHEQFNRPRTRNARRNQTDFFKKLQVCMMMYYKCRGRHAAAINPRSVGSWFRSPEEKQNREGVAQSKWYDLNKQESQDQVQRWIELKNSEHEANMMFDELDKRRKQKRTAKQDDMTDAYRICRYVRERHLPNRVDENAVKNGWSTYMDELGVCVVDTANTVKESLF